MSRVSVTPVETPRQTIGRLRNQVYNEQRRREQSDKQFRNAVQNTNRRINEVESENRRMEQSFNNAVDNFESDIKEVEIRNRRRISDLQNDFTNALKNQEERLSNKIDNLQSWTQKELGRQRSEYLEIKKRQQRQIENVRTEVEQIKHREENTVEIVSKRLNDVKTLVREIDDNEPHQRFASGELDQIKSRLKRAENDLNKGDVNFASGVNQAVWQAYDELLQLREKIYIKKNEFQREYLFAMQMLESLLGIMEEDEIDVEAKNKKIDYWTESEFSNLKTEIQEIRTTLEDQRESLSVEQVKEIQERIRKLEDQQSIIVNRAVNRVIASQQRKEMAKDIALRLIHDGDYQGVDGNGYEGNDPRESYLIRIKKSDNQGATETTAVITPREIEDEQFQNILAINTTDHFPDDESAAQSAAEVVAVLEQEDLDIGETKCVQSHHDPELSGEKVKTYLKQNKKIPQESKKKIS